MQLNGQQNEIDSVKNQKAIQLRKHQNHLKKLNGDNALFQAIKNKSPKEIFENGLTITNGINIDKVTTKMILLAALTQTWRAVRLPDSRSWQNQTDLQHAIDDVIDVFPTLKIEEFGHVMKLIRRGNITLFGRFDTPSLIGALRDYEMNHTVIFRENKHHERLHDEMKTITHHEITDDDKQRFTNFIKQLGLQKPKKTLEEIGGSSPLTEKEILTLTQPFKQ